MPFPLIRTKLHRPPVSKDHLHRQHLLDRLNERRYRPLTLVSAPAGYGKSTLISCWLESCDSPYAWISLDANDSDLRSFMIYFIAAIDSMFPGSVVETRRFLKATDLPPIEVLSATLINELYAIDKSYVVVLDDYHKIRATVIHEQINQLLLYPPENMHLVLITRRDPPFPIANMRVHGQLTEIRMQQLRFSTAETQVYLCNVMKRDVDSQTAAIIDEKTEGWAAGLRLAVLSIRDREDVERIISKLPENNRYVMDYIISEVVSHQPSDIQDYLLSSAVLNRFCASLCEAICISENESHTCSLSGQAFIEHIEHNNIFCIPLDDNRYWFRFHHLFKQLLERELKRRYNAKTASELHNRAGRWFARHDLPDEALRHLLSADNLPAAGQVVIHHRYALTGQEQWHRLNSWIEALPKTVVNADPELLLVSAWLYENRERMPEMRATLEKIEEMLANETTSPSQTEAIMGEICALRASDYYLNGDIGRAREHAVRAITQIPHDHLSERAFALLVWAFIHQMEGNSAEAHKVVYREIREDATTDSTYSARLLLTLCFLDWMEGDLASLRQNASRLLNIGRKHELLESETFANYHLGLASYCMGEKQQAAIYLEAAVKAGQLVDPNTYVHGNCALALSHQADGQSEKAHSIVLEMHEYALRVKNTALLQTIKAFNAELALHQGRMSEALNWARKFAFDPLKQVVRFFVPQLTQAKILLTKGSSEDRLNAHDMLNQMHQFFNSKHNKHCLIEVFALKALQFFTEDNQSAALEALTTSLSLAHQSRRKQPFLSLGEKMADMLRLASRKGQFQKYISEILTAFDNLGAAALKDISDPNPFQQSKSEQLHDNPLTNRELDVIHLLYHRLSNKEIATKLFISPDTVKRHTINIYKKLAVHNRQDAVAKATGVGLLQKS